LFEEYDSSPAFGESEARTQIHQERISEGGRGGNIATPFKTRGKFTTSLKDNISPDLGKGSSSGKIYPDVKPVRATDNQLIFLNICSSNCTNCKI